MTHPAAPTPPNILLILVDDLGWTDLGCYGSSFYETPHIDALARTGALFTDAYAAAPVCSPSRASLMTGKYPARVGVTNWIGGHAVGRLVDVPYFHALPENEYSLARALRAAGYATWHVGKWHLGSQQSAPEGHGFEVNIGGSAAGSPSTYFSPYSLPGLDDGPEGEYLTERLTDEAVQLIHGHSGDRPFFLNLWHYTVHTPCQAPEDLIEKYRLKADRLGLDTHPLETGEPMPTWHLAGRRVQRRTLQSDPVYAAMVETLDDSVGALVAALERSGQLDNTIIIFTSDNGGLSTAEGSPTCNRPLAEGKGWMEDGGLRVPLIISGPGVAGGVTLPVATTTPDLYPTVCAFAGAESRLGEPADGVGLGPALGGQDFDRGPIFWHYPHYSNQGGTPAAAVRDGRWKLIRYFEDDRHALFDLLDDIGETRDLVQTADPELVRRLTGLLDGWLVEVEAAIPRPNSAGVAPWD